MRTGAAAVDRKNRFDLCAALLLIGAWRHFGWALFDVPVRALVSKASGAAAIACLLLIVWRIAGTRWMAPILLWWAWEELQVVLCSTWFIFDPWPVPAGQAMCSARVGFDIGAAGVLIVAVLAFRLTLQDLTATAQSEGQGK